MSAVDHHPMLTDFSDHAGLELLNDWHAQSRFLWLDEKTKSCIVHAGIVPRWSVDEAKQFSNLLNDVMHGEDFKSLLSHMEGDTPACLSHATCDLDRYRYGINVFTPIRFCDEKGCLDVREKESVHRKYDNLKPWFDWPHQLQGYQLFYGHWAA